MVLLKNDGNLLPLTARSRLALIGPQMNATSDLLSNYHWDNTVVLESSPLQILSQRGTVVASAKGCAMWGDDRSGFPDAVSAAKLADVAVVFVGL